MNYKQENAEPLTQYIDCYWESHDMGGREEYIYPSLPEPYISFYFELGNEPKCLVKGITNQPDYLRMRSNLFGVRLLLKGFFQVRLTHCTTIQNQIKLADQFNDSLSDLAAAIAVSNSFNERIELFLTWFERALETPLTSRQSQTAEAFQYLIQHYDNPKVINQFANEKGISPRTVLRWFSEEIGMSPKKLVLIIRFNHALYDLHAYKEPGFYFDHGYVDQAHFIKEFKLFTHKTPEQYLKMVSELYN